jgi:hypothetical protein
VGEGVVLELIAWRGVSAQPLQEAAERLVEVAQRVLERVYGGKVEPLGRRSATCQFFACAT